MNKGLKIVAFVALGVLFVGLIGYVTMSLWNWLVPGLFNGPIITFWQALGLLLLSKLLFWGFGGKGHHHNQHRDHWKRKMYAKFSNMSPDQREAFKQKMRDKWCTWDDRGTQNPTDSNG